MMSYQPNDPFDDPSAAQAAPVKKSRRGCFIGCLVVSGLTLLVCCGGGYWMVNFVSRETAAEVERRLTANPVILEHIGELESVNLEILETSRQTQQANQEGKPGVLVFGLSGSKGSGQLVIEQNESNGPDFGAVTLVMPDGTRHEVNVTETTVDGIDVDDLEMELGDLIDSGEIDLGPSSEDTPPDSEEEETEPNDPT